MKLRFMPAYAMLTLALLACTITPSLWAAGFETSEDAEAPACTVCCEDYTENSIIIQYDCNETNNPHFCLSCASKLDKCPTCRNVNYKIHDPRVSKDSYERVHHRQKPLTASEQQALRAYLTKIGSHRISLKATPDTVVRLCATCNQTIEANNVIIELGCGHTFCLQDAVKVIRSHKNGCPVCKKGPITILDPIQKNDQNKIVLKYLLRAPTKEETEAIQKIRTCGHLVISQEHIPADRRVPVHVAPSRPAPTKKDTKDTVTPTKDDTPEVPGEFTEDFTPEEFKLNFGHVKNDHPDLPILKGAYPLQDLSEDDMRLNKQLPNHLDPKEWQVVILEDGSLARIKRAQRLTAYPTTLGGLEQGSELLKGYRGDILAGLLVGLLVGQDVHKPDRFTPKPSWLLYGATAVGAYALLNKANPNRTFKPKHALRWATGIGAGIAAHAILGS